MINDNSGNAGNAGKSITLDAVSGIEHQAFQSYLDGYAKGMADGVTLGIKRATSLRLEQYVKRSQTQLSLVPKAENE